MGRMAHGLEGLAGGHGAVTDDGHGTAVTTGHLGAQGHAQGGTDGGGRMPYTEGVVFGFAALGKPGQSMLLTDRSDALATPGENLVRVTLMTYIPDQPVVRGVVQIVQGHGQLHHPESGAEVAAGLTYGIEQVFAQFIHHLLKLTGGQTSQFGRADQGVQQRSGRARQRNLRKGLGHNVGLPGSVQAACGKSGPESHLEHSGDIQVYRPWG